MLGIAQYTDVETLHDTRPGTAYVRYRVKNHRQGWFMLDEMLFTMSVFPLSIRTRSRLHALFLAILPDMVRGVILRDLDPGLKFLLVL